MTIEFRYEAITAQGATVEGIISANDDQDALLQLRSQSLTPVALKLPADISAPSRRPKRMTASDKILVVRELATLLRAGIPLADAVNSLASARGGTAMGEALQRAWRALNAGETFVAALEKADISFPVYVSQLAATGEITGKLAAALTDAARQMEYDDRVRQELRNSLTYPVILVMAGISAVLLIFLFVVPRFANLVKGSRAADIPEISLWVINIGLFMKSNWLGLLLVVLALIMALIISLRDDRGRTRWLSRLAKAPLIGVWLTEAETGRWATTLGTLLGNRVPILSALELAAQGLRFPDMRRSMQFVLRDVRGGATLADTVAKYGIVNATGINLIRVGEKSGELPQMVATLGELQSEAGRNRMKRFLLMLEPIAILVLGAIIAVIMVAIMMAITSINTGRF
jgi:general secretion pathway protein F